MLRIFLRIWKIKQTQLFWLLLKSLKLQDAPRLRWKARVASLEWVRPECLQIILDSLKTKTKILSKTLYVAIRLPCRLRVQNKPPEPSHMISRSTNLNGTTKLVRVHLRNKRNKVLGITDLKNLMTLGMSMKVTSGTPITNPKSLSRIYTAIGK